MSTDSTDPRFKPTELLEATLVAPETYVATNDRGAEVRLGRAAAEGVFTPGELLHIALAACAGLSADHVLPRHLGEDYKARVTVESVWDAERDSYSGFKTKLILDLSGVDEDKHQGIIDRAMRSIDRVCTVSHTLTDSATSHIEVVAESK